jgi:hypothetical protein
MRLALTLPKVVPMNRVWTDGYRPMPKNLEPGYHSGTVASMKTRTSSDSLRNLLDGGKKICLAPMAAGGTLGIAQLGQGQYLAAILSVSAGSAMTLILLGSMAVGSLLVASLTQRRGRGRKQQVGSGSDNRCGCMQNSVE